MGIKSILSKPLAKLAARKVATWRDSPEATQREQFNKLLAGGTKTAFGREHQLENVRTPEDFRKAVPIRDYEGLRPWVERVLAGELDVLWKGKPLYLAKTSGTTSGAKYIPITRESMPNHINGAKNALLSYIEATGESSFVDGKMMFLQGSPVLEKKNGIHVGRLSGIVAHHVPAYLQKNRLPGFESNCIDDWETKVDAIVAETRDTDLRLIGGIPSWVQMYFERLLEQTGKATVMEVFPNLSVYVHGGVNYQPYRDRFQQLIGKTVDGIEFFPASEGFLAFQDEWLPNHVGNPGLLLILDAGIYYEFIPAEEFFNENPTRLSLWEVEPDVNYVIIINSNAGLWGYNLGDTVKFVSIKPYRVVVTGRIKHYTSAFGEHVIAEEVEHALRVALSEQPAEVIEFTVAPQINPPDGGLPYHEWLIEFAQAPADMEAFAQSMDQAMQQKNIYYRDLLEGNILRRLEITPIAKGGFNAFMKSRGKLGGQNKVPRLGNDRQYADALHEFKQK